MTNLRFYALQDTKTGIVSMFATSQSDEYAIQFYINSINEIYDSLKKKEERVKFLNSVHNSKVVRLADIDCAKPEIVQNLAFIADLNNLVVKSQVIDKNEKKEEK